MLFDTLISDGQTVCILDQTTLPYAEQHRHLDTLADCAHAIRAMQVRGAPLIGATAAYGVALAMREDPSDAGLGHALTLLAATRPTAVNLQWALSRQRARLTPLKPADRRTSAWDEAAAIHREDVEANRRIGEFGLALLYRQGNRNEPLQLMTHCNAGALATCGWGTALAPIYLAFERGLAVHVWVSETRPRNQGLLTAWELARAGVPHTVVADNAAAELMREGRVDAVIVGADRIAANGDTANKIGTCLKAYAAHAHQLPFYVAAPSSTLDPMCPDGSAIPIENRADDELLFVSGQDENGASRRLRLVPDSPVANPAFDVTPAELVSAYITERGVFPAARLHEAWQ